MDILKSRGCRNIIGTYYLASTTEQEAGRAWYAEAHLFCLALSDQYDVALNTVAGVVASLSPNNKWERNKQDAENIIRAYVTGTDADALQVKVCTYNKNKDKAIAILNGSLIVETLSGPKVIEFYHCIMGHSDVCIDGHAYSIWHGDRLSMKDVPSIGAKLRQAIKQDYIDAATYLGIQPYELQATAWVVWRRIFLNVGEE